MTIRELRKIAINESVSIDAYRPAEYNATTNTLRGYIVFRDKEIDFTNEFFEKNSFFSVNITCEAMKTIKTIKELIIEVHYGLDSFDVFQFKNADVINGVDENRMLITTSSKPNIISSNRPQKYSNECKEEECKGDECKKEECKKTYDDDIRTKYFSVFDKIIDAIDRIVDRLNEDENKDDDDVCHGCEMYDECNGCDLDNDETEEDEEEEDEYENEDYKKATFSYYIKGVVDGEGNMKVKEVNNDGVCKETTVKLADMSPASIIEKLRDCMNDSNGPKSVVDNVSHN